ncbi:MAG: ATP synthase F0 subunit B, partial [Clostridiales bacterium]|nr:ATP synthase F0 subunit B [Clostridiales bacterium]
MIDIGPAFIWTAVNLIILFLLMKKFLFKPVTAHMENRTRKIKEGLENAEKLGAEADEYK